MQPSTRSRSLLRRLPWWLGLVAIGVVLLWGRGEAAPPEAPEAPADPPVRIDRQPGACGPGAQASGRAKADLSGLPLNELLLRLEKPTFVSPPRTDGPTTVGIALHVYEISDIDPATNTFAMEGYVDLLWCDPREAFDPGEIGVSREIFLEKDADRELEFIWWPDFYFVNEVGPRRVENEELIILPDGTIEYREKFGVTLAAEFDMRKFPFDTQILEVEVESFAWSSESLVFELQPDIIEFSNDFEIPEWSMVDVRETIQLKQEPRDRHEYSELVAQIEVRRDPGFYVTKIMLPLGIIVGISWAVFWMIGDTLADRMSVSFTGVLTSVAYQFIVSESLPRHIYDTFLDGFVLLSFLMMVATIVENILVNSLALGGRDGLARRVDQASRVLFPATYGGGLLWLVVTYVGAPAGGAG